MSAEMLQCAVQAAGRQIEETRTRLTGIALAVADLHRIEAPALLPPVLDNLVAVARAYDRHAARYGRLLARLHPEIFSERTAA